MRPAVACIRVSKHKQGRSGLGLEARHAKSAKVPINLRRALRASTPHRFGCDTFNFRVVKTGPVR